MEGLHATYYHPLSLIESALRYYTRPASSTDRKALNAIQRHWPSMMTRVCSQTIAQELFADCVPFASDYTVMERTTDDSPLP